MGQHARLLAGDGYGVKVIAGRGQAFDRRVQFERITQFDSQNTTVLHLKASLDRGVVPPSFQSFSDTIAKRLREALRGVDAIFAHNVGSLHKNLALTAALKSLAVAKGAPKLVLWHHDFAWGSQRYQQELHPGRPWSLLKESWANTSHVVVSEARKKELVSFGTIPPNEISVIPNGVDAYQFLGLGPRVRTVAEQLHLFAAAPILLLPVRITRRKNIELALRTLGQLREVFPAAVLIVTGPFGAHNPSNLAYFQELKHLRQHLGLQESAVFIVEHGDTPFSDGEVAELFRIADAVILPSNDEGFGIPLIEAGLVGLPVFSSLIPALKAIGGNNVSYFAPDDDPAAVAGLIANKLGNCAEFNQRVKVRQQFTWSAVYKTHLAPFLKDLV
jgi:glycosyltransferase involved in cell wall biosynthesis